MSPTSSLENGFVAHDSVVVTNGDHSKRDGTASPTGQNGSSVPKPVGSYFGHDRQQVTRILIQSLTDLGYHAAATALSKESNFQLENDIIAGFRDAVLQGDWPKAESLLVGQTTNNSEHPNSTGSMNMNGLPLAVGTDKSELLFLIRRQKLLEMLEKRQIMPALTYLRHKISPLAVDDARLNGLPSLIMSHSAENLKSRADWDGAGGESRSLLLSQLSKYIAPSVMIPERRLAVLLDQVQDQRIADCLYHNTADPPSLYHDHTCSQDDFPMYPLMDLREHASEVWVVRFSHDGSLLATGSKDNAILIYDTSNWTVVHQFWHPEHELGGRHAGIACLSFSPDDRYLISCSPGYNALVIDLKDNRGIITRFERFEGAVTAADWLPDGRSFILASQDPNHALGIYDVNSTLPVFSWSKPGTNLRVDTCSVSPSGDRLAVGSRSHLLVYDLSSREQIASFRVASRFTNLQYSQDGTSLLASSYDGIKLIDTKSWEIMQRYEGPSRCDSVIRSAFGGANESFIISGSQDSSIFIWRKQSGAKVTVLDGHKDIISSVAWHPKDPTVFVSGGDDMRVVIWANRAAVGQDVEESTRRPEYLTRRSNHDGSRTPH